MTDTVTPKIYVACLAAYNNGMLFGEWIDATQTPNKIYRDIYAMLAKSPIEGAEEFAIHDFDDFYNLRLEENSSIENVSIYAQFIEQHGALGAAVLEYTAKDVQHATEMMEHYHLGEYESAADYAQEIIEETQNIPDHLAYYIDYEAMARDMELNGEVFIVKTEDNRTHLFRTGY
jgi:antirestriction protein